MDTQVIVAIQARLNNTRLPRKLLELIGGKTVLTHVIEKCLSTQEHINLRSSKNGISVKTCLLVPTCEVQDFMQLVDPNIVPIIDGSEHDVLSRYMQIFEHFNPKYIVRITSDCPLIPSELITKHIYSAVKYRLDYVSNVDERYRTSPDGYDCEVISCDLMRYLDANAKEKFDREHVTTWIRSNMPNWARVAHIIHNIDQSNFKCSLDTKEDLAVIKKLYESREHKISEIKKTRDGIFNF